MDLPAQRSLDGGGLQLRHVARNDFERWLPLWDGYNAFYGRSGATALPMEITNATFARFLDPEEPMHGLIAEQDGRLLGFAHYLFHASTISVDRLCYLQDLFTAREARGRGVASALIECVHVQAVEAGAARLYWHTHETNAVARRLYDKVGERSGFLVYRKPLAG